MNTHEVTEPGWYWLKEPFSDWTVAEVDGEIFPGELAVFSRRSDDFWMLTDSCATGCLFIGPIQPPGEEPHQGSWEQEHMRLVSQYGLSLGMGASAIDPQEAYRAIEQHLSQRPPGEEPQPVAWQYRINYGDGPNWPHGWGQWTNCADGTTAEDAAELSQRSDDIEVRSYVAGPVLPKEPPTK